MKKKIKVIIPDNEISCVFKGNFVFTRSTMKIWKTKGWVVNGLIFVICIKTVLLQRGREKNLPM